VGEKKPAQIGGLRVEGLLILRGESPGNLDVTILPEGYGHIVILGNLIEKPVPVGLAVAWNSL